MPKCDDLHSSLISYYRGKSASKTACSPQIQSKVRSVYTKKAIEGDALSPVEDFLRNQDHLIYEEGPLQFRELPRALKVYFPGPPAPPPRLEEVPYTYETVPPVKFKMPKQKPGFVPEWTFENAHFKKAEPKENPESVSFQTNPVGRKYQPALSDRAARFRSVVKQLVSGMSDRNLSLYEIIKNKGLIKKPYAYHNSLQFFLMVKAGDSHVQTLVQKNNLLAFDVDEQFMTGLHWAARCGHPALVKLFVEKYRASLVAKDSYGRHPIHLAVQNRSIECIIRLVVEGSKTTVKDSGGRSAKDLAPDNYVRFLLNKLEEIKFIVRARGYKDVSAYKQDFEKSVRAILDVQHQYF